MFILALPLDPELLDTLLHALGAVVDVVLLVIVACVT